MLAELITALEETLFMVFSAGLFTWCLGLPLGVLLKEKTRAASPMIQYVYRGFTMLLNAVHTVPYLILMIAFIPLSQKLLGSETDSIAAIIPMTIAAVPGFAKSTEAALSSVPKGVVDLAISLGATRWQIIYKILIPEALPSIIQALTDTFIRLIGYSIVAGALGCGGLGALAIEKGYGQSQFEAEYLCALVAISLALVQIIQTSGQFIASGTPIFRGRK